MHRSDGGDHGVKALSTVSAAERSAAAVILNWNGWRDTIECLESLLTSLPADVAVIVCDNASSDGSVERIRAWVVEHAAQWGPTMLTRDDAAGQRSVFPRRGARSHRPQTAAR